MKIIQLIQRLQLRGAEMFACQLANQLQIAGHNLRVVALMDGQGKLPYQTIKVLHRLTAARLWDVSGWRQLDEEIRTFRPDVVQANAGDTLKFAVFSKLFFGWKTPIVFRNANKVSDFINSSPKLWFNRFLVSRVQHVISVSELCRQDFVATYRFPAISTSTIPIGLDLKSLEAGLPTDLEPIFSSGRVLVQVASLVPEKNPLGLIRIFAQLLKMDPSLKLLLVGDGKLREVVKAEIEQHGLQESILMLGYRMDVMAIVQKAHAFLLPSHIEGLPGVILEAMYCKTPVIAYDVGGISEVVKNGQTGWLVPKGDETGFVDAVHQVLQGDGVAEIVENAYRLVSEQYDNRQIAKRFEEVYRSVADS